MHGLRRRRLIELSCLIALLGCSDASRSEPGFEGGGGEGDGTTGTGGGSDGGGTGGDDGPAPEDEEDADFRVPQASGRFVYSASTAINSVAVIDSETLAIDVVGVGRQPTVVVPIAGATADQGAVAVLDQGSDDVALLLTDAGFTTEVELYPVTPGANNLAASLDGRYVFVYHDVDGPESLGPGSDQEVTVIDTMSAAVHEMTVGTHPWDIQFDAEHAYVLTDDGVNVITLAELGMVGKPDLVPVVEDPGLDPDSLEVQLAVASKVALARVEGEPRVTATDLQTKAQYEFALSGIPTDLDVADDGSYALLTLPGLGGSRLLELQLPVSESTTPEVHVVDREYVGLARLTPDGNTAILYTTVDPFALGTGDPDDLAANDPALGATGTTGTTGTTTTTTTTTTTDDEPPMPPPGDPRQRVTIARRGQAGWSMLTLHVERAITAVGVAPDGLNAMLLHADRLEDEPAPYGYTLLDLAKEFPVKKLQLAQAVPSPIMFTPEGDRAVVLQREDSRDVRRADMVDLRSFIVDGVMLGSPPQGVGYVDVTQKIYVSQEHPTGRITFIGAGGDVETVTGYQLNDSVKD